MTVQLGIERSHFYIGARIQRYCRGPLLNTLHINADGVANDDAVLSRSSSEMCSVSARDQSFGRHAAGIDTRAAEQMALDQRDLLLRLDDGGGIGDEARRPP